MIKVLIVNDSLMVQQALRRIIETDPELELVGIGRDGQEGIYLAYSQNPDVILMDIRMPHMDGVQATEKIMRTQPKPILVVTGTMKAHMSQIYDCLNYGALEVLKAPTVVDAKLAGKELLSRIRVAAALKKELKKTIPIRDGASAGKGGAVKADFKPLAAKKVVAIGASTGGPNALLEVLRQLPGNLPAGILLVQHIDPEFAGGLAEWLSGHCGISVSAANGGHVLSNGTACLAAEAKNLVITSQARLSYQSPPPNAIHIPSIDVTLASVAEYYGKAAMGIILTGMGSDGVQGLKKIRAAGGVTVAQDEETSLIYGMPRAAKESGAAEHIIALGKIAEKICEFAPS